MAIYANLIAERTGLGSAFIGLLLLAGATSLPEIGRTITAASNADAVLAIDSLLGGIVLQTAILAIADLSIGVNALTFVSPQPVLLLEGALLVVLIGLAVAGIAAGSLLSLLGISLWSLLLIIIYLLALYLLQRYESRERWQAMDTLESPGVLPMQVIHHRYENWSIGRITSFFALMAAVVLIAGVTLVPVGEALAIQTGLGAGFIGATLLAGSTSLPEFSTTIAAVRLGAHSMAISNIFGSNALLVALIFVADAFHRPGPVLSAVDRSASFAAAIGICATGVYLAGLTERHDRTILRMGLHSAVVLTLFLGGTVVLYFLR